MKRTILLPILILLVFSSCKKLDLRSYYFQPSSFERAKEYVFTNQNDTSLVQRWHMHRKISNGNEFFYTTGLDHMRRPMEVFVEQTTQNQSVLKEFYFISYDFKGNESRTPTEILKNEVFSFLNNNDLIVWSVKYVEANEVYQMTKTRKLQQIDVDQIISGVKYKCVQFRDDVELKRMSDNETYTFNQVNYYAKNTGLVRFVRTLPDQTRMDFHLSEIIEK